MEKHKCKLCLRSFSNGRALGGHMRSHMLNLPIVQKPDSPPPPPPPPPPLQPQPQPQPQQPPQNQLSGTLSASFSSSSSSEDDDADDDDEKGIYGLRENPKRSIRLVDPEFVDGGSVILPDRESETESSKNPTRKRSKRTRTLDQSFHHQYHHQRIQEQAEAMKKQPKFKYKAVAADQSSWAEPEPVSSISDTTPEEDVAFCLMMLSRDKWKKQEQQQPQGNIGEDNEDDDVDEDEDEEEEEEEEEEQEQEQEEDEAVESDESEELIKLSKTTTRTRGKFKCETCKKTFRSYQALGGHRASHKKIKLLSSTTTPANNYEPKLEHRNVGTPEKKIHECPVCFRVFSSGQALGGHKRTHVTGSTSTPTSVRASTKLGQALIDLNLPAPMEDDDISQIELSAVSDAEFVNPIRR